MITQASISDNVYQRTIDKRQAENLLFLGGHIVSEDKVPQTYKAPGVIAYVAFRDTYLPSPWHMRGNNS